MSKIDFSTALAALETPNWSLTISWNTDHDLKTLTYTTIIATLLCFFCKSSRIPLIRATSRKRFDQVLTSPDKLAIECSLATNPSGMLRTPARLLERERVTTLRSAVAVVMDPESKGTTLSDLLHEMEKLWTSYGSKNGAMKEPTEQELKSVGRAQEEYLPGVAEEVDMQMLDRVNGSKVGLEAYIKVMGSQRMGFEMLNRATV